MCLEAPILKVCDAGTVRKVFVRCPYCSKKHQHGGGYSQSPDSLPTQRSAHCGRGEYKIVLSK